MTVRDFSPPTPDLDRYPYNTLQRRTDAMPNMLGDYAPKEIEAYLHGDGGIIGQDAAVRAASLILHHHVEDRPSVSLFAAPTGSGKTEIWRALQRATAPTNIRIVIHDASSLTAEGWRGGNKLSTIFRNISDPFVREHMILVLDEFDKLLEPQMGDNGTNFSDITQNQLLKLFDHDILFFGADGVKSESTLVDTSNISVVLLGAFEKLLRQKSSGTGSIGFGADLRQELNYGNTEITPDDLIAYGMRPEIAGRITRIVSMSPLTAADIARIGRIEAAKLSRTMDAEISVSGDMMDSLAQTAVDKGLGARYVKSQLVTMLDDLVYENPWAEKYRIGYDPEPPDMGELPF